MLSVKSWIPGSEKPPCSLTFMIRRSRRKTNCLKWKAVKTALKNILECEYMHDYRAGNTGREGTSVWNFSGSLHLEMKQAAQWNLLVFPQKQIYLSVSLSVKEMLPWGIFDAIYSYLFVSVWHFVKHKSKWENKVHQGGVLAEREVYHWAVIDNREDSQAPVSHQSTLLTATHLSASLGI